MKADNNYIFISYSRDDEPKVTPIVEKMTNSGYHVWYDTNIHPGDEWSDRIASKIEDCTVCVAFHSQASRDSPYCREEIYYARNQDKTVISVYLDNVELKKGLKMRLSPFQSVRYANPAKLLKELRKSPEFELCGSNAPQKRNGVNTKKIAKFLLPAVSMWIFIFALVAFQALFELYKQQPPIGILDENGVLDIVSLPFSKVEMMDYNYYPDNDFNPPSWAAKTPLVQCVVIRKGVTHIGDSSFQDCSNMKSVFIPQSVTSIGKGAFLNCMTLKEINLPYTLESLGSSAFSGCTKLKEIDIPWRVKELTAYVFLGCTGLEWINSDDVEIIRYEAFYGCTGLKKLEFPSITLISIEAFSGCTGLESVSFSSSLYAGRSYTIDREAFSGCTALKQVQFFGGIEIIENSAFSDCTALEEITIPNSIRAIGKGAFSGCTNLKTVHIQSDHEVQIVDRILYPLPDPNTIYIDSTAFDPGTKIIFEPPDADADVIEYIWGSD